jgi:hypothetical protein
VTRSSAPELDGVEGTFTCGEPRPGVHGPVRVANQFHFAYADGTPYFPIGTTCYAWIHQGETLERQTLESLREAPFNKLRMCVFPKHYRFNENEPDLYPFERGGAGWDFTRFNPAFFCHLEQRVDDLAGLGIEADLILFHPYDRWGFADMGQEADDRYLRYLAARLASFRNVWWSMANEYDILRSKTLADWDRFFQIVQRRDPHDHLRSVHNWQAIDRHDWDTFYDHCQPWVTHCSVQHGHVDLVKTWREQYGKPVVVDECCYEGDIPNGWGNITGEEMVRRFWEGTVRGGYVGHGETYMHPDDVIWWSKGGKLIGQSPARIAFLRNLLESLPAGGLAPLGRVSDTNLSSGGQAGRFYLTYFGYRQPARATITLEEPGAYAVDQIDTWEMTTTTVMERFEGSVTVPLPGKPYLALLVRAVDQ